jgi:hypothetical protein
MNIEMLILLAEVLSPFVGESSFAYATRAEKEGLIKTMEAYEIRSQISLIWHDGKWITGDEFSSIRLLAASRVAWI